jgi:hypothetical protein
MMKNAWRTFVTAGMFVVRMLTLALMALLQLTVGGADIHPETRRENEAARVGSH